MTEQTHTQKGSHRDMKPSRTIYDLHHTVFITTNAFDHTLKTGNPSKNRLTLF